MGTKETYRETLDTFLDPFLKNSETEGLKEFIENNSNLPGPRANLELAAAFKDSMVQHAGNHGDRMWELCKALIELSPEDAPVNDPKEFIPFCGTVGIGALGAHIDSRFEQAQDILRALAQDQRWRMREAVRMGLQELLRSNPEKMTTALQRWIPSGNPLEMRAVATAVSDLELLLDQGYAARVLEIHREILAQVSPIQDRKSKSFRALRKALGFTLSIVVCACPEAGLELIDELIDSEDKDLIWIARSNLKKRRFLRNFPEQAERRLQGM